MNVVLPFWIWGKLAKLDSVFNRLKEEYIGVKTIKQPLGSPLGTGDLGYIGVRTGNYWVYRVSGGEMGSGYVKDSVYSVYYNAISSFGVCNYLVPKTYNFGYILRWKFVDSTIIGDTLSPDTLANYLRDVILDTSMVYGVGGLLEDVPYSFNGVRFVKENLQLTDSWPVLDTCIYKPRMNSFFAIGDDIDNDGRDDSMKVIQTNSRVLGIRSDTMITLTPVVFRLKLTTGWVDTVYNIRIDSIDGIDSVRWVVVQNFGIKSRDIKTAYRLYVYDLSGDSTFFIDTSEVGLKYKDAYVPPPGSPPSIISFNPPSGSDIPPNAGIIVRFNQPIDPRSIRDTMFWVNNLPRNLRFKIVPDTFNPLHKNLFITAHSTGDTVKIKVDTFIKNLWGVGISNPDSAIYYSSVGDITPPIVKVLVDSDTTDVDTLVIYQPYTDTLNVFVQDFPATPGISDAWITDSANNRLATLRPCDGSSSYSNPDTVCVSINSQNIPQGIYKMFAYASDFYGNTSKDSVYLQIYDTVGPYIVYTYPANGQTGVSTTTYIQITFNEPMNTGEFYANSIRIRYNSTVLDSTGYNKNWVSQKIITISLRNPLPYDDTVWVIVDSLKDVVGNWAKRDSFYFITQKREDVFMDFIRVIPDSVYIGDSVLVLAQASSAFAIRGGMFYLDGSPYDSAKPYDGTFDETVETLYVYVKTDNLNPGVHSASVEAYNDYTTSSKASTNFKVLNKPPLLDPKNVLVIPNPVKGSGKIKIFVGDDGTGGDVKVKIEVFNIRAARVLNKEITTQKLKPVEIPLPDLPPDIYVLRVIVNDKRVEKWFGVIR